MADIELLDITPVSPQTGDTVLGVRADAPAVLIVDDLINTNERTATATFTNKTIALGSNTVSGTKAQFNAAMTDADFATLTGTETLTNKTVSLGSNTVSGTLAQFNTAVSDADLASLAGAETLTNKTIALGSNTVSGTIAQLNTAVTDADVATLAGTETLTNKTINLTSNTVSATLAQINTAISDADVATLAGAETLTNKTLTSPKINENVAVTATATEINILDGVTASTAEINILDGVTATAEELNILDGVTTSTAELNFVDGVTSAIQTQMNTKAPSASPTFTGDVYLNAAQRVRRTTVADTAYTVLTTDALVAITSLTAPRTITLPAAATAQVGRMYMIQDESGNAGTHTITVDGNGAETINGNTTHPIDTNYGGIGLYSTGSAWIIPGGG